jgi:general secretion pathway protein D
MIRKSIIFAALTIWGSASAGPLDVDKKISLQFDNVPIASVLKMISQQYDLNIVQSGEGEKKISVKLDNVSLSEALQAILISNGYNYYSAGEILVVKPIETEAPGETAAKIITLNHITPGAAVNAASELLSAKGKIKIVEDPSNAAKAATGSKPTQIVVVDLPEIVDRIEMFLKEIDQPRRQIAIEVRMIERRVDREQTLGLNWPTTISGAAQGIKLSSESGSSTSSSSSSEALGQIQLPNGQWEWGKLSVMQLQAVLDFLETSGDSKLISNPRLTTLDNHAAEIKVSTIIPIQTINRFSEGGSVQDIVTFQDEEVGISLTVTPHVADSDKITLDVNPTVAEIIGYAGSDENIKPITSERTIQTMITVKDGETAVLGGLIKEDKIEETHGVFFLGSLPILGALFRHKTVETSATDLMILITPTIVRD